MADMQQLGAMLGGFGAGIQGQLPQFIQAQNQTRVIQAEEQKQKQISAQERLKTAYLDADASLKLINSGNIDGFLQLGTQRLQMLQQFPDADPSDTQRLMTLGLGARNGSKESLARLQAELEDVVEAGKAYGILTAPKAEEYTLSPGQARYRDGEMVAQAPERAPTVEGFEIISPEQAAQMGLPPDKQYQMNKTTQQISQIGSGPAVQVNTGNPTEGERTAGILANRLDFAQSQINDILAEAPQAESPEMVPTVLGSLGFDYLSRVSNPAERQVIEAAQDDMLDAALTLGTGAAYTETQFKAYKRSYFPQLGDDQKTIDAKAKRLTNLLDAAYAKAGRGAPPVKRSDEVPVINSAITTTPPPDANDPLGLFAPSVPR